MTARSTQDIATHVGGQLLGPGDLSIDSLEELGAAARGQLTFIGDQAYALRWPGSEASAALVNRGLEVEPGPGRAFIVVDNADLAMAKVLELFAPDRVRPAPGVHPSAEVHDTAKLGGDVHVGPGCVIGPGVKIGAGCILHANVAIFEGARIGAGCELWPGVVIRERCTLGQRCILHSNAVIGTDGFGYRPDCGPDGVVLVKIPQIGTVRIGDDVEIGAGAAIDRGKFSATVVGDSCKIDNLVQIGHNCHLGNMVIIAGGSGIGGSTVLEDGVVIGGMAALKDHITIGTGAKLAGGAQVISNVPPGETWAGTPARELGKAGREYVALRRLPDLLRKLKKLK